MSDELTAAGDALALAWKSASNLAPNLASGDGGGGVETTVVDPDPPPPQADKLTKVAAAMDRHTSLFMILVPCLMTNGALRAASQRAAG